MTAVRNKYRDNPAAQAVIDREQYEIDLYLRYQKWYGSAFIVMRRAKVSFEEREVSSKAASPAATAFPKPAASHALTDKPVDTGGPN